jgi:hypothetical protein
MNTGQESFNQICASVASLSSTNTAPTPAPSTLSLPTPPPTTTTNTIKYVIDKKIATFEDYLDSKVINIYQRPWNKLEPKLKLKKLDEYYLVPLDNAELSTPLSEEPVIKKKRKKGVEARTNFDQEIVKSMLIGSDKKRIKVDYDVESCTINSILIL